MQSIVPNLWFDGNAKAAVDYYVSVFKDAEITGTTYYPTEGLADFQKGLAGKELTVSYRLLGMDYVAINAGPEFKFNESVSFSVACKDQAEIDYYWERLSAVPESEQCGWCKDKYGLSWQIVPANMEEIMSGPSGTQNQAAWQVMMNQHKIVIRELLDAGK